MGMSEFYGHFCICMLFSVPIILVIIITIAIVTSPDDVKFYIDSASLTQFNLINGTTLHFNLTMGIGARNPNKKSGACYNKIRVAVFYKNQRFGRVPLPRFCQGHKSTTLIQPVFVGQSVLSLQAPKVDEYYIEKGEGLFNIGVVVSARVRSKVGPFKSSPVSPDINCNVRIPIVPSNGSSVLSYVGTDCDVYYPTPDDGN